jgi:assimilatory nitrate reductase catalytic subunit
VISGTRTACPYCGVGCGVVADADGRIAGDPDHPANAGRLCSKGTALGETLGEAGRLLRPSIHGRETDWDEALGLVAERFAGTIAEHGPDSVAFYVSGQCLTEDYYVANKLMKGFIGSANIDTNSRLCMASSVAGHARAFGEDIVPACYEDLEVADLVVLTGSNAAWCHPVLFQRLAAARERHGTKIVVIDPRRTATCEIADLHLPLRSGSDVALWAGLLAFLDDEGRLDRDWVATHASGLDDALAAAREGAGSVERVSEATGLDWPLVARFYDLFARTERVVTGWSQGVNQSSAGTDKVNAIINCHLATGRIGRPGAGPLSLTGQPNAMGGREVGGLANQLAAHMGFDQAATDRVRRFWAAPRIAERPGLKAVDLFRAIGDGRIKAVWIISTNPVASLPEADRVRAALETCPFVVVSESWAAAETARYAHVLLPAAAWGEKDGTVTNSERVISRQRAFRAPPGEARPDWWMLAEVARRMGWGGAFAWRHVAAIFREHAALSAFENRGTRLFDLGAWADLSDEAYDALEPFRWGPPRLFANGGFPTPDGRARIVAVRPRGLAAPPDARFPYVLNTGRVRDQWHTMTRTGIVARLMSHTAEPFAAIHPEDGAALGIADGGLVRVEQESGAAMILRVRLSVDQRRGEIFVPMHWNGAHSAAGAVGALASAATDPVSGQPELKGARVRLAAVPLRWRGILVRRAVGEAGPDGVLWSRIPIDHGEAFELAGTAPLPAGSALRDWIDGLIEAGPGADILEVADPARQVHRRVKIEDGSVAAALFLAGDPAHPLPGRDLLATFLARPLDAAARLRLIAGGLAAAEQATAGGIVCACHNVSCTTIEAAIAERGLATAAEIGALLRAGTNCGSCIPELKAMLRRTSDVAAAA